MKNIIIIIILFLLCINVNLKAQGDINFNVTPTSCLGNDGSINATLVSGNAPITFQWSNGVINTVNGFTDVLNNLPVGAYSVTMTDAHGCTASSGTNIIEECLGCTNSQAHNFNPNANVDDNSCETCSDGVMNGDETDIDCGGVICQPCAGTSNCQVSFQITNNGTSSTISAINQATGEVIKSENSYGFTPFGAYDSTLELFSFVWKSSDGTKHATVYKACTGQRITRRGRGDFSTPSVCFFSSGYTIVWEPRNGKWRRTQFDENGVKVATENCGASACVCGPISNNRESASDIELEVLPNPNNGTFTFKLDSPLEGILDMKIFDMTGRVVYEEASSYVLSGEYQKQIHLPASLAEGMYNVKVVIGEGQISKRIVIMR